MKDPTAACLHGKGATARREVTREQMIDALVGSGLSREKATMQVEAHQDMGASEMVVGNECLRLKRREAKQKR